MRLIKGARIYKLIWPGEEIIVTEEEDWDHG
jgi:hypothetical protein